MGLLAVYWIHSTSLPPGIWAINSLFLEYSAPRYPHGSHPFFLWKSLSHVLLFMTSPWNSPGQNIRVGSLSFLQGIFPSQELNPGLPHCRQILYQLSHKRSPRIPEWVAYPFSRGSSSSRNQTRVSCIASGFFANWAMTLPGLCSLYPQNNTILFPCSHVPQLELWAGTHPHPQHTHKICSDAQTDDAIHTARG